MHKSAEEANKLMNGFCNPNNALFVSHNSQETNESLNADLEHENIVSEEDCIKKDIHYQDCISSDLLKQIESNSPIRNEKQPHTKIEHSKFYMQNSGGHHSPINANGNYPSFFPKKMNLWKQGNARLTPIMYPVIHERQFPIVNDRYIPQGLPRAYLTPINSCMTFSNYNDKSWKCIMCKGINSESKIISLITINIVKNQCSRCNYVRFIPLNNDQRKSIPVQIPSPLHPNTNTSANDGIAINLSLKEIAQINQMQYNQLKKINHLKELRENEKEKKYYTPVLSSNLKEKLENGMGNGSSSNGTPTTYNKKKKKPFAERAGDWVCIKCKNLNFSFRSACNRCNISKSENDKLYEQYMNNLMNYCKVNDVLQLKYSSPNTSFPQWISTKNDSKGNHGKKETHDEEKMDNSNKNNN